MTQDRAQDDQLLAYANELRQAHEELLHNRAQLDAAHRQLAEHAQQELLLAQDIRREHEQRMGLWGKLQEAQVGTIRALATAIEARDSYTGSHVTHVAHYALVLGQQMGLEGDDLRWLEVAALVHDVGKIGIPDGVLNKVGKLDDSEWRLLQSHAALGAEILSRAPEMQATAKAVRSHHERWDGHGYPDGLDGENIPLHARIITLADSFDAMTRDRSYQRARNATDVQNDIDHNRGRQFDPHVVDAFRHCVGDGRIRMP